MSVEENKALIYRLVDEIANTGSFEELDDILAPNYVEHIAPPGIPTGPEAFKRMNMVFRTAFPDWLFTIDDIVAADDRVVIRGTGRGTHTGNFMGIPPTGKSVTWHAIHLFLVKNGKVAARWAQGDVMGLLQQLGVISLLPQ